ncbi:MAG: TAT-variant-translocated molybdopterin oxidoreductase [Candidatus Omnitrophica bacterium]|nr:TAT-variant-translocated molybdopterin oxidoreductase [Candidatus Omnitrophota bacterium]
MSPINSTESGQGYWRSLQELARDPAFLAELGPEFAEAADSPPEGTSRRRFLQVMAASVGLAGLTGCRWPKENIYPYANRPDGRMPGVPVKYATCLDLGGSARGLLATSYDGRPIKVDGNDLHPINRGANDVLAEASVLDLYDPDRTRGPIRVEKGEPYYDSWDHFNTTAHGIFAAMRSKSGAGVAILSEASSSPTFARLKAKLLAACPQIKWFEYEPVSNDNERVGTAMVHSRATRPHYSLSEAKIVVGLDGDLFETHPAALLHARDLITARNPDSGTMNRLYAIESGFTLAGALADHRFPVPASQVLEVVCRLIVEAVNLGLQSQYLSPEVISGVRKMAEAKVSVETVPDKAIAAIAKDLMGSKGASAVTVGFRQPPLVHALVHTLNAALDNVGRTVRYTPDPDPARPTHLESIRALNAALTEGQVETLVILGGNPVYNAPADLDFGEALKKAKTSLHLNTHFDETSRLCSWHVPRAHYLETWGDGRAYDGTLCVQQPLIHPLYEGKSALEFLSLMTDDIPQSGYDMVRETVKPLLPGADFEVAWRNLLSNGIQEGTQEANAPFTHRNDLLVQALNASVPAPKLDSGSLEVVFRPHPSILDGRFANNGWLQELPDFITKVSWDNPALFAVSTAAELDIRDGDMLRLKVGDQSLEVPAYVLPGQPKNSIGLSLGFGRSAAGRVGNGVGFDTYRLRASSRMDFTTGVQIEKTGKTCILAGTQDHFAMDEVGAKEREGRTRALVREANLEEYKQHPDFAKHGVHLHPLAALWQPPAEYGDNKWGMTMDLHKCIGCNACVVACQSENNIPVVGKEQVHRQREMHWIRIDRYFKGSPENPQVAHQPVACVHCENAPCEQVCPVGATVHDHDGLNVMVYNRCIGTRYCSNNCPYKVRRFNFFHYHTRHETVEKMVFNPEVTVRSRGVMEKCTFCIQRVAKAKIEAKNERRPIRDGEVQTACQVACPTGAIVFGDLNDKDSRVVQQQNDPRAYLLLEELNVRPRTAHLARVRNPHPDLAEAHSGESDGHAHEHDSHS